MKIRELRDFGFFAIKEVLLILPMVLSAAVPKTFLDAWGLVYAFTAPSVVVLAFSRRSWSSFTYPKAHFLSAMAVCGGIILFRSQTSFFASWAVLLYAVLLAVHPFFKGMVTALGNSERSTGAWIRLSALFMGLVIWNLIRFSPYEVKLWVLTVPILALSLSIIFAGKNWIFPSGKASFGREFGSMGNPMPASSLLVMALPIVSELTFLGISTGRYWYLITLPFYGYGFFASAGRGALLGVLLSVPFIAYMGFQYSPWWLLIGMVFFVAAALSARKYLGKLWQRIVWTFKRGLAKEPRFFLWRDALYFCMKEPFGSGYDSFRRAFMPYRSKESYLAEPTVHYDKVHNVFLEEWAEGTIAAFVLVSVILVELFLKGSLALKGAIFAVIGDGFFGIYNPANWLYLWMLGSLASLSSVFSVYWLYPFWGLVVFAFVLTSLNHMPQVTAGNAHSSRLAGQRDIAAQLFNAAYTVFPWCVDYLSEWALLQMALLNEAKLDDNMAVGYHNTFKGLQPYLDRFASNIDDIYSSWLMFCGKYASLRKEGESIFSRLQQLNPYSFRVRKACAHYLGNVGNWDVAMSLLEENINEYHFDADSYYMLVLACYEQHLWSTGRKYLQLWRDRFPNDGRITELERALGI